MKYLLYHLLRSKLSTLCLITIFFFQIPSFDLQGIHQTTFPQISVAYQPNQLIESPQHLTGSKLNYGPIKLSSKNETNKAGVIINEVVTKPKLDWSTNNFNGIPGTGSVSDGTDEWIELLICRTGINLTGWTIELMDGSDVVGNLTSSGAFDVSNYMGVGSFTNTVAGDYLILGNVDGTGAMNNSITINLKDPSGAIIDAVTFGSIPSSNASNVYNESAQRFPNGTDSDTNIDWTQGQASMGASNTGPSVSISISSATISENNTSSIITIILCAASNQVTTINLSLSGTATSGTDFSISSTTITIPAGSLTGTATLTSILDTNYESDETVVIDISSVTNGTEAGIQQLNVTILETQFPVVVLVTSTVANGVYNTGDSILVTVTFNMNVKVSGTPQLTLETGSTDRIVDYFSGSGTNTLSFNYVVQSGENNSDLDYESVNSLAFNGGLIKGNGFDAILILPLPGATGSLGANKSIVVDTKSPVIICCPDTTIYLDNTCLYTIGDLRSRATATDFCSTVLLTQILSGSPDLTFDGDSRIDTIKAEDCAGNTSFCTFRVTAEDTIRPVIVCRDTTVYLDSSGTNSFNPALLVPERFDNCDILSITPNSFVFNCNQIPFSVIPNNPWINEFHYDNNGTDVGEFVEIAGKAGTNLTGFILLLYNGSDGKVYKAINLSGIIPDEKSGFGAISFPIEGIQNGPSDGLALISQESMVIEFKSYEGTLVATDGPAIRMETKDISVSEPSTSPIGSSVYCKGPSGWALTTTSTPGLLNPEQELPSDYYKCQIMVSDINGNASFCYSKIKVLDTIPPRTVCHDTTIFLDQDGEAELSPDMIDSGSSDNCAIRDLTLNKSLFAKNDFEENTVTLSSRDFSGNVSTCQSKVTVSDSFPPTALCRDAQIILDNNGLANLTPEMIDNKSFDNSGPVFLVASKTEFNCLDLGENSIKLTVIDKSWQISKCFSKVTVIDNSLPIAICKDTIVYLDETGYFRVFAEDINGFSTDNCGIVSRTLDHSLFDCENLGYNKVIAGVEDKYGNKVQCSARVMVKDSIPPVLVCHDTTIYLDALGQKDFGSKKLLSSYSDNCGILTLIPDSVFLSCGDTPQGLNSGSLWINEFHYDNNGTDVGEFVEIAGKAGTSLSGFKLLLYNGTDGKVYKTINLSGILPDEKDGFGSISFPTEGIQNGPADGFALVSPGSKVTEFISYEGTLVATDGAATRTASKDVGVSEPIDAPVGSSVFLNEDGLWEYTLSSTPGLLNPGQYHLPSTKVVRVSATDRSGNTSSCLSFIRILDSIPPIALCKNIPAILDGKGVATISARQIDNGSYDNCSVETLSLNKAIFDCSDLGNNLVKLTVADAAGNLGVCYATVSVSDTTRPAAVCRDIAISLDKTGKAAVTPEMIDSGSTDNCLINSRSLSKAGFDCSDLGVNTVELHINDAAGNFAVCQAKVTVEDHLPPVIVCKDITLSLDSSGMALLSPAMIAGPVSDNCTLQLPKISKTTFDCSNTGINTVALTVSDGNGNQSFCNASVTIIDTIAPKIVCKDLTVWLDADGKASIAPAMVDSGTVDNCGILSLVTDKSGFGLKETGIHTVSLTATDFSHNSSVCQLSVSVTDTVPPRLACRDTMVYLDNSGKASINAKVLVSANEEISGVNPGLVNFGCNDVAKALAPEEPWINEFHYKNAGTDIGEFVEIAGKTGTSLTGFKLLLYNGSDGKVYKTVNLSGIIPDEKNGFGAVPFLIEGIQNGIADGFALVSPGSKVTEFISYEGSIVATDGAAIGMISEDIGVLELEEAIFKSSVFLNQNKKWETTTTSTPGFLNSGQIRSLSSIPVRIFATDFSGNTGYCSAYIEVKDTTTPVAAPIENRIVYLEAGKCESTIDYPSIVASDNCGIQIKRIIGKGPDGLFSPGIYSEKYNFSDISGNLDSVEFTITVITLNIPPTINDIPDKVVNEDSQVKIHLTGISDGGDCPRQVVGVTAFAENSTGISKLEVNYKDGNSTADITATLQPNWFGETKITIEVCDSKEVKTTKTFTLKVNPVNDPPVLLTPLPDVEFHAPFIKKIYIPKISGEMFGDPDDAILMTSISCLGKSTLPGFITFVNDTIQIAPTIADTGKVTLIVRAKDSSGALVTDTFSVNILAYQMDIPKISASFSVDVYPNPTKGILNVIAGGYYSGKLGVEIYSSDGKLKIRKQFSSEIIQIDVGTLADGLYYLKVKNGPTEVVKNFIIKRE